MGSPGEDAGPARVGAMALKGGGEAANPLAPHVLRHANGGLPQAPAASGPGPCDLDSDSESAMRGLLVNYHPTHLTSTVVGLSHLYLLNSALPLLPPPSPFHSLAHRHFSLLAARRGKSS